jgi:D-inositol-3-phosphate glycosyltransferase
MAVIRSVWDKKMIDVQEKPRLLVIGQANKPTGYARVLQSIVNEIHEKFDILYFGMNYKGPRVYQDGWVLEPNHLLGDIHGQEQIPLLLESFQPDLLFMCHDPYLLGIHKQAIWNARKNGKPKVVYYCPIEFPYSPGMDPYGVVDLAQVDRLVVYNEFGKEVILDLIEEKMNAGYLIQAPPIDIVPHGVDTKRFYPLSGYPHVQNTRKSRLLARQTLFPERPELEDAFIILNANRNSMRKRLDLTLEAFARFSQGKDDVWLHFHTNPQDTGTNVMKLAETLGVMDRLLITTPPLKLDAQQDKQLNLVYNACDVGVNTSTGEGWGLIAFEHAAAGALQIVPDHSACRELWKDHGMLIKIMPHANQEIGVVSTECVTEAFQELYADRSKLQSLSERAYDYVTSSAFQWPHIAKEWEGIFIETLTRGKLS